MDTAAAVKRLCSEIQLFDLCEKGACSSRDGRFCTDAAMLAKFEAVREPEDSPRDHYLDDEMDEDDEGDDLAFDDAYDDDEFEGDDE